MHPHQLPSQPHLTPRAEPPTLAEWGHRLSARSHEARSSPAWRFVPAADAVVLSRWDADFHIQAQSRGAAWVSLAELGAEVAEGVRAGRARASEPTFFRPSQLVHGLVMPDAAQLVRAPVRSPRAVGPGDLLISKALPCRAGVVIPSVPRHAPDDSCLRVLGLRPHHALWVAALFEHPTFAADLARRGAGRALPRLNARELTALPLPSAPAELSALVAPWLDASEARLTLARELLELRQEAQALADDAAPLPPDPRRPTRIPAIEMPHTWAPDQVALAHYQHQLHRAGWVPLGRFLSAEPARLRQRIPPARVLRLGHATGELGFRPPELAAVEPPWFRLYADPIRPGELLLSTLGSAPKVVLNEPASPSTLWLSDQWARLDGVPGAGALALLLETSQVAWQLASAATGAVRQFIARDELAEIRVPASSLATVMALHRRVLALLARRAEVEARHADLRARLVALVTQALEVAA